MSFVRDMPGRTRLRRASPSRGGGLYLLGAGVVPAELRARNRVLIHEALQRLRVQIGHAEVQREGLVRCEVARVGGEGSEDRHPGRQARTRRLRDRGVQSA